MDFIKDIELLDRLADAAGGAIRPLFAAGGAPNSLNSTGWVVTISTTPTGFAATLGWDRVGAYHAGLTKQERTAIEQWFFSATDAVLVATCAYGIP